MFDLLPSMLQESELGGRGQSQREGILSCWQLLDIKDVMVGLQEDGAQVGHQGALPSLLQARQCQLQQLTDRRLEALCTYLHINSSMERQQPCVTLPTALP